MASSKKTLDIDTLTFTNMYIKSQSQISSYTIPVITNLNTNKNVNKLTYMTPQEALSSVNININTSTIPSIISSIEYLSSSQLAIQVSISSVSDILGNDLSSISGITLEYTNAILGKVYPSTISTLLNMASSVKATDLSLSQFNGGVIDLKSTLSSLYFTTIQNFSSLRNDISIKYNPNFNTGLKGVGYRYTIGWLPGMNNLGKNK